jgi:hypothetical protein
VHGAPMSDDGHQEEDEDNNLHLVEETKSSSESFPRVSAYVGRKVVVFIKEVRGDLPSDSS